MYRYYPERNTELVVPLAIFERLQFEITGKEEILLRFSGFVPLSLT